MPYSPIAPSLWVPDGQGWTSPCDKSRFDRASMACKDLSGCGSREYRVRRAGATFNAVTTDARGCQVIKQRCSFNFKTSCRTSAVDPVTPAEYNVMAGIFFGTQANYPTAIAGIGTGAFYDGTPGQSVVLPCP